MTDIRIVTEPVKKKPRERPQGRPPGKKPQVVKNLWSLPGDENFINCSFCGIRIGPNYWERVGYEKGTLRFKFKPLYPGNPYVCENCAKAYC